MKVNQELLFFGQEFYTSKKSQITLYHNNNKLHNNNQNLKIVTYLLFRISIIDSNSKSMATFKIKIKIVSMLWFVHTNIKHLLFHCFNMLKYTM